MSLYCVLRALATSLRDTDLVLIHGLGSLEILTTMKIKDLLHVQGTWW